VLKKASRSKNAGNASRHAKHANKIQGWDFAIAWRPGWHITVFPPPWWILVCVAITFVAAAIVAAIWVL
jgi:hypothetical protein